MNPASDVPIQLSADITDSFSSRGSPQVPDLRVPANLEEFQRRVSALWPRRRWHAANAFDSVLQIYREYTSGDTDISRMNRFLLGFWCPSRDRICYSMSKLSQQLGRNRSLLNAVFAA
jgi:hypothetical protein